MKKNIIAFGLTANRVFAAASVLMDISRYCSEYVDEVVIFHDKITQRDQLLMQKIFPTRFIIYEFPVEIKSILNMPTLERFTYMVFAKFESLRLLDEYKKVLWLDDDIVIMSEISELFDNNESGIKFVYTGAKVQDQFTKPLIGYDMNAPASGAMPFIVQDHLINYKELYNFCYQKLEEYASVLYLPEQAIFDLMIQEFKLKYDPFNNEVYCADAKNYSNNENVKILHSFGFPKFWNGLENEQWNQNYKKWIEMGGSRYKTPSLISKIIKKSKKILGEKK